MQTTRGFDDGEALFEIVCGQGLEGVVAKRRSESYRPGERCRGAANEFRIVAIEHTMGRDAPFRATSTVEPFPG